MTGKDFGLSKKTNVALGGLAAMGLAKDVFSVVIVMAVVVIIATTYQFIIDRGK